MRAEKSQGRLTVYFEDPFWIGVFERIKTDVKAAQRNPKRAQRDAKKQTLEKGKA